MGCRVSIQFTEKVDGELEKSSVIYHHWAGNELPKEARGFLINQYKEKKIKKAEGYSVVSSSVDSVIFDFIQHCFKEDHFSLKEKNSVLICDKDDITGSDDAGHYIFELKEDNFSMKHIRGDWQNEPVLKRGPKGF